MAINSNAKVYSVSWLLDQRKKGHMDTDISIQRQPVWNHQHQSNLILAMLNNVAIPNLWIERVVNEKGKSAGFRVIDGKQRTLTLVAYLNDAFPISAKKMRYVEADGIDITGKKYSQLPEEFQDKLREYQLTFSIMEPMFAEEREKVFFWLNQGIPVGDIQLIPSALGEVIMNDFVALCKHSFMVNKFKLTAPAIKNRDNLKLLIYYMILESGRDMGFSGKEVISFCDSIRAGEYVPNYEEVASILDYLDTAIEKKRAYLKLINMPIMMFVAKKAIDKGMEPNTFGERVDEFFHDVKTIPNHDYQIACMSGSAKKANIQQRVDLLSTILDTKKTK
jgi:hypothetical protein